MMLFSSRLVLTGLRRKSDAPRLRASRTISRSAKALTTMKSISLRRSFSFCRVSSPPISGMTRSSIARDIDGSSSMASSASFPLSAVRTV